MLCSLALIFLCGMLLGHVCSRVHLPPLLGMLVTGMILGPYALNWIDPLTQSISTELRRMALIIILTRAGLRLDLRDLRQVGRPAILLCFVPATLELVGVVLLAPPLLGMTRMEAAVLGAVLAAVSPAVVVPRMLRLMEQGLGVAHRIPQMILAGASADDVYVIVLFTAFSDLAAGGSIHAADFVGIPVSMVLGLAAGAACGAGLAAWFRRVHMRDSAKVVILLSVAFLLVTLEDADFVPFSGLLAVMAAGVVLRRRRGVVAERLAAKYGKLWVAAELLLFALVGATVDVHYALWAGPAVLAVLFGALALRMLGVWCCLLGTKLSMRERVFCMLAYTPKATVQAAIGGLPLAMGLACGPMVLTAAVAAILLTAPLGAWAIDATAPRLLL